MQLPALPDTRLPADLERVLYRALAREPEQRQTNALELATELRITALVGQIEATARAKLRNIREALADENDRREAFLALFPKGLSFSPTRTPDSKRQVWKIRGGPTWAH